MGWVQLGSQHGMAASPAAEIDAGCVSSFLISFFLPPCRLFLPSPLLLLSSRTLSFLSSFSSHLFFVSSQQERESEGAATRAVERTGLDEIGGRGGGCSDCRAAAALLRWAVRKSGGTRLMW
jgi:hypothetical protein